MPLTAPEAREAQAKRRKTVEVLNGDYKLRALSAGDIVRSQYEYAKAEKEGHDPAEGHFRDLALSLVDATNALLFPLDDKGEPTEGIAFTRALDEESFIALVRAMLDLNGTTKAAGDDIAKN